MSISSINYGSSVLGAQIRNINQQLTDLSTQLSTGKLSQNYSGMGTNEGFAIAGRAQLSNIAAYTDTMTNVNVSINLANTALQSLTTIRNTVQTGSANTAQDLNVNGQTVAQNTAAVQHVHSELLGKGVRLITHDNSDPKVPHFCVFRDSTGSGQGLR